MTVLFLGSILLIFSKKELLNRAHLEGVFKLVAWVSPQGWATQVAMWFVGERREFPILPVGLLAILFAFAVPCFRAIRERLEFPESDRSMRGTIHDIHEAGENEDGLEIASAPVEESRAADVEQHVLEREFLQPWRDRRPGWIERFVVARFPQFATTLDFLLALGTNWSSMYFSGLKALVAGPALAWLVSHWSPVLSYYVCGFGLVVALAATTPLFGGSWPGLEFCQVGGRRAAIHALLPVDVRAIRRAILGANFLRFVIALPVWLAVALLLGHEAEVSLLTAARIGGQCWLLAFLMQPLILVFMFSQGTSDSNGGCLTQLLFLLGCGSALVVFGLGLILVITTIAPNMSPSELAAVHAGTALVLAAVTFGFEAVYRRLYARQRFDLLTKAGT